MTPIQETPRNLLSRRALLGLAAGAALVPVGLSGGTAQARRRVGPAPETVALPDGFRPEGIASGPGTTYYAGSMANGRIVTGDLLGGPQSVLLPPADGRAIRGLYYDDRSGLLWFVGNVNTLQPDGTVTVDQYVWAINTADGCTWSSGSSPSAAGSTTTSSSRTPTSTSPTRVSTGWSGYRSTPPRGSPAAASASSRSAAHGR